MTPNDVDSQDPSPWAACAFAACVATRWYAAAAAAWLSPSAPRFALGELWRWLEHGGDAPGFDVDTLMASLPLEDGGPLLAAIPGSVATVAVVRPLVEAATLLAGSSRPRDVVEEAARSGEAAADELAYLELRPPPPASLDEARGADEAQLAAPSAVAERNAQGEDLAVISRGGQAGAVAAALRAVNEARARRIYERARALGWP
jgi:hypothetical protein